MKKECVSRPFKLKQNPGSLSRAVSWINFSSLSRQTKRLFRSDGELSSMCVQQVDEDDENWIYRSQQRKGDSFAFSLTLAIAAAMSAPGPCCCPAAQVPLRAGSCRWGRRRRSAQKPRSSTALPSFSGVKIVKAYSNQWENL